MHWTIMHLTPMPSRGALLSMTMPVLMGIAACTPASTVTNNGASAPIVDGNYDDANFVVPADEGGGDENVVLPADGGGSNGAHRR